jgi:hypothetical protein
MLARFLELQTGKDGIDVIASSFNMKFTDTKGIRVVSTDTMVTKETALMAIFGEQ